MSYAVAFGGKGGTGKTTVAGLLIRYMIKNGMQPVLAVDADSNSNLNDVLGVKLEGTIGDAREDMKKDVPTGMTKDIFMEMRMEECIIEGDGFDLIAMGCPEGAGCYCAANNILAGLLERLIKHYDYMVIDNEAGMEHFSRLTQKNLDLMILVSDASRRGMTAACRIAELVDKLPIGVKRKVLIINQLTTKPSQWPDDVQKTFGDDNVYTLPADNLVADFDLEGKPTSELPADSGIVREAEAIFAKLLDGARIG